MTDKQEFILEEMTNEQKVILKEVRKIVSNLWEKTVNESYELNTQDLIKFGNIQGFIKIDYALEKKFGKDYADKEVK